MRKGKARKGKTREEEHICAVMLRASSNPHINRNAAQHAEEYVLSPVWTLIVCCLSSSADAGEEEERGGVARCRLPAKCKYCGINGGKAQPLPLCT